MERTDWLLLFIGLPGDRYDTDQLRVMKGLFLLGQEGPQELRDLYNFTPYDFGPFDTGIYRDLSVLEAQNLIAVDEIPGTSKRLYRVTPDGQQRMNVLTAALPEATVRKIREVKGYVTSLSFINLLREVYAKYPAYAVKSVARL